MSDFDSDFEEISQKEFLRARNKSSADEPAIDEFHKFEGYGSDELDDIDWVPSPPSIEDEDRADIESRTLSPLSDTPSDISEPEWIQDQDQQNGEAEDAIMVDAPSSSDSVSDDDFILINANGFEPRDPHRPGYPRVWIRPKNAPYAAPPRAMPSSQWQNYVNECENKRKFRDAKIELDIACGKFR